MPCSLQSIATVVAINVANKYVHRVLFGKDFLEAFEKAKMADKYANEASSSALPTTPDTASVWT